MHYVIGDIHCQVDMLERLLKKLDLQPDDEVYFVGDWFDRAHTEEDYFRTLDWMIKNLGYGSRFKSVCGNHDMSKISNLIFSGLVRDNDMNIDTEPDLFKKECEKAIKDRKETPRLALKITKMIEDMPLYYRFEVDDREYIVTHSWLIDRHEYPIGMAEFDIDNLDKKFSVWDRCFSTEWTEYEVDIPTVIHGHTPTLGRNSQDDFKVKGVKPLAKIQHVSDKNINIDCCAFRSPMLGGNLAAYRCEDGREFYAYEDDEFYKLADLWAENTDFDNVGFDKYEYMFLVLFYKNYHLLKTDVNELKFDNDEAKEAYNKMKEMYIKYTKERESDILNWYCKCLDVLKQDAIDTISRSWVELRDKYQKEN